MKLIFDIGANLGDTVEFYKELCEKVVCFEPNENLHSILESRFKEKNVVIDKRGLSNNVEIKKFTVCKDSHVISTFSDDWINNSRFSNNYNVEKVIEVETTTLDNIIEEYGIPDFVKIDVEGYEYEVLSGLNKILDNTTFAFEWAEEQYERINKIANHLMSVGYKKFSFTYRDSPSVGDNLNFENWESLSIHIDIDINRKEKWGMIYFKK